MACSQCLGESLEDLAAGLAGLVDVLYPVFRDALEGRIEYLFVASAEFDDLHALRLDLFGRGLLAVLEALAALARGLLARFNQGFADVLRQRLEFGLADRIGEDRGSEVQPLGAGLQDLAEVIGHRALIRKDQAVERAAGERFIDFRRSHPNRYAANR